MPEYRQDPWTGAWFVLADERARRPHAAQPPRRLTPQPRSGCPFCPGNERALPGVVHEERGPDGALLAKVVPNRYPALVVEEDPRPTGAFPARRRGGLGAHEVVIEGPAHDPDLCDLPDAHIEGVLRAWAHRVTDLYRDRRLLQAVVFRNREAEAGATLEHPHSQVVALPLTPPRLRREFRQCRLHFRETRRCLGCAVLEAEASDGRRIVLEDEHAVVLAPWASRMPFELMLLPRAHAADFQTAPPEVLRSTARLLGEALRRLRVAVGDPATNLLLHTGPNREAFEVPKGEWATVAEDFHWHVEILPRLVPPAGFEWGTGLTINPTLPEDAARVLRSLGPTPPASP